MISKTQTLLLLRICLFSLQIFVCIGSASSSSLAQNRMAGTKTPDDSSHQNTFQTSPDVSFHLSQTYRASQWGGFPDQDYFNRIESIGLKSSLGFSKDIWLGLERSLVRRSISGLPKFPQSPKIREITRELMITGGDPRLLSYQETPSPGQDFLTLRLKKLNQIGAFKEAAKLYKRLPERPYHPDLVLSGITALMISGENEEACLDVWGFQEKLSGNSLWGKLIYHCQNLYISPLFSDTNQVNPLPETFPSEISWSELSSLSLVELYVHLAYLASPVNKQNNQEALENESGNISEKVTALSIVFADSSLPLSSNDLSFAKASMLFEHDAILPDSIRLHMAFHLYQAGALDLVDVKKVLQSARLKPSGKGSRGKKNISQKGTVLPPPLLQAAIDYQSFIKTTSRKERLEALTRLTKLSENKATGPQILHPVLSLLNPDILNGLDEAHRNQVLLAFASAPELPVWVMEYCNEILRTKKKSTDSFRHLRFISATLLLRANHGEMPHSSIASAKKLKDFKNFSNILEGLPIILLDISADNPHIPFQAYEKQMGLTSILNYVIKTFDIKQPLHSAVLHKSKSQISLFTLMMSGNRELHNLEDGILYIIVKSLVKVRLTDLATHIYLNAVSRSRLIKKEY